MRSLGDDTCGCVGGVGHADWEDELRTDEAARAFALYMYVRENPSFRIP